MGDITPHMRAMMDDLGLSAEAVGASSIFTGDEEVFAFARAVVRAWTCLLFRSRADLDRLPLLRPSPPLPPITRSSCR